MLVKVKGLVIRSIDLSDNDKLITMLTEEYGKITAVANGYVYYLIRKIDMSTMTIKEALTAATNVDIVRRRMKILGWVLAMPLLVILFYAFYEVGRDEIIYGAWVGLVIGAICGGIYERNTRQLIRQMRQTLADELGEDEEE